MTNDRLAEGGNYKLSEEQEQLLGLTFAIRRAGSYDAFLRQLAADPDAALETGELMEAQQAALRNWLLQEFVVKPLTEDSKWERLARRPDAFAKSLDRVLSRFSGFFKQSHGIAPHRPITETARDRKIWQMRQDGKTFGQIAQRLDMSPKVAERAFKRREIAIQNQTEQMLDMLRDALIQTGFPFNKTVPSHPVM
jgi:hypothetical protein